MRKTFSLFLALLLCILLPLGASAARFPQQQEVVTNETNLLSKETVSDLTRYAGLLKNKTDITLHVVMVYFLDGMDAQSYANALFAAWDLGENDLLLLISAAEDSFALSMGAKVNQSIGNAASALLYSTDFSNQIALQNYNLAIAAYFREFNQIGALNGKIDLGHLFANGNNTADGTVVPQNPMVQAIHSVIRNDDDDKGLSPVGWFFLVLLILIIGSQSDTARKRRRMRNKKRSGVTAGKVIAAAGIAGMISQIIKQIKDHRN